jgi:DNA-binding HxlR family transcriptional regulator
MTTAADAQALIEQWERGNVLAADCPSRAVLQHLTSRWGTLAMLVLSTGPHRSLRPTVSSCAWRIPWCRRMSITA